MEGRTVPPKNRPKIEHFQQWLPKVLTQVTFPIFFFLPYIASLETVYYFDREVAASKNKTLKRSSQVAVNHIIQMSSI